MDEVAPWARERVPFQRGEAHRLHLQRAFQVLFDRFAAAGPAIGVDLHPFARRATEQVVQRQAGVLGDDVPHRDFDRAPGRQQVQRRAAHREIVEQHLRCMANAERAAADDVFAHVLQQVFDDRFLAGRHIGLAPAMQAAFRLHAAEQQVLGRAGIEQEGLDAGDLHGGVSLAAVASRRLYASDRGSGNTGRHAPWNSRTSPMRCRAPPRSSR